MLTVTQIDYIKHLRNNEDTSISEIASRVQCDWKTAKKYADGDINLQKRGKRSRRKAVMGVSKNILKTGCLRTSGCPRSKGERRR